MTETAGVIALPRPSTRTGLSVRTLAATLLSLFAADNLLLLHFWGVSLSLTVALAFAAATSIWVLSDKIPHDLPAVPLRSFATAFAVALALLALGGEGRFFYANADWQIRDAVLRDLATNPWPFAYDLKGVPYFLRAPLGTYLLPAMFANADLALLVFNAFRLALLMALAWQLFENSRARVIALTVFILFSGWDIVGTAIYSALGEHLSWDHIERWNYGYQYSSHVTQAFWVPQHAIAGWACAVMFLLWRKGMVPIGLFAATIPLVAIWSPLAIMGAIPFALFAGIEVLRRRALGFRDVALAAIALSISLPALLYLKIDAADVGMQFAVMGPVPMLFGALLEVLPFAWPLLRKGAPAVADRPVIWLVLILLLIMPMVLIGTSVDFQTRASIMPLALLAIAFAQWIIFLLNEKPRHHAAIAYAFIAVAIGAVTPLLEIRRAVMNEPSPRPRCSLVAAWRQQTNTGVPYASYLAPVSALPAALRDVPVVAGRSDPDKCWDREWMVPIRG